MGLRTAPAIEFVQIVNDLLREPIDRKRRPSEPDFETAVHPAMLMNRKIDDVISQGLCLQIDNVFAERRRRRPVRSLFVSLAQISDTIADKPCRFS